MQAKSTTNNDGPAHSSGFYFLRPLYYRRTIKPQRKDKKLTTIGMANRVASVFRNYVNESLNMVFVIW